MWHPSTAQWRLLWLIAAVVILAWPGETGSLAVKAVHWAADPFESLPPTPSPLALGLGDDPESVERHDAEEAAYYRLANSSTVGRFRLWLRDLQDPFEPSTGRQVVLGVVIFSTLGIWRLEAKRPRSL